MFLMVLMMIRIAIMLIIITSKLPGRVTCQCYINTWASRPVGVAFGCGPLSCVRFVSALTCGNGYRIGSDRGTVVASRKRKTATVQSRLQSCVSDTKEMQGMTDEARQTEVADALPPPSIFSKRQHQLPRSQSIRFCTVAASSGSNEFHDFEQTETSSHALDSQNVEIQACAETSRKTCPSQLQSQYKSDLDKLTIRPSEKTLRILQKAELDALRTTYVFWKICLPIFDLSLNVMLFFNEVRVL